MAKRYLQIFGYVLAILIVVGGTRLLIAFGNGYTYDFATGKFIHRGLIIVSTNPSGASISVNGKDLHHTTSFHQNFRAGWYTFTLTKFGYRTWTNRIESIPSQATLVQYVLLLPDRLVSKALFSRPALTQFTASPDHSRIAFVVPSGDSPGLYSFDPSNGHQTKLYASAAATDTASTESITIEGWAADSSRVLISSHTDGGTTFLVVPTGGGQPVDLGAMFGITSGNLQFNPSNSQQLYWLSSDGLHRIDIGAQTISDILVAHLGGYTFAGGRLLYVDTTPGRAPSLWSLDGSGHTQRLENNLPVSQTYNLTYASYNGTAEAVVAAADTHQAILYNSLFDQPTTITPLAAPATQAAFNGSGRFVSLSDGQHLATYDLQYQRLYALSAPTNAVTGLTWFDNFHLLFVRGGQVVLSEFDGNYATALMPSDGQTPYATSSSQFATGTVTTSTGQVEVRSVKIHQ